MKRHLISILTLLLLAAFLSACGSADKAPQADMAAESAGPAGTAAAAIPEEPQTDGLPFYGTWVIRDCQPAEVSALSPDDTQTYLGCTITYQADMVLQDGQEISVTGYTQEAEPYTEESLAQNYKVNLGEWWSAVESVAHVSVTAPDQFFGNEFFIVDAGTLWIYYEGVFFIAKSE